MSIYQVVFGMPKSKVKWTLWDFFSILPQPYFNFNLSPKIVIFCEDPEYFSGPKGKIDHKGFSQMGVGWWGVVQVGKFPHNPVFL